MFGADLLVETGLPPSALWLEITESGVMEDIETAMGQRVVAEGVETEVQRDWLRAQGCELVQGWFSGKADLPANLGGWIHRLVDQSR